MQTVFPVIRYENASRLIHWLCNRFGFRLIFRVPDQGDYVRHAQLEVQENIIIVGSVRDDEGLESPLSVGVGTQSICVYIKAVENHFQHSVQSKVEIIESLTETDFGSLEYHAKDPEGHLWTFSNYHLKLPDIT